MEVPEYKEVKEALSEILKSDSDVYKNLVTVLQEVQKRFGFLPETAMAEIAKHFDLSPANVYGVATFYNQFRFVPPGRCHVQVCMGTACHIKQGGLVLDQWKRKLEIEEGGRTEDGEFSIERVACVGACTLAPVCIVCGDVVPYMSPTKVDGIILQHQIQRQQEEQGAQDRDQRSERQSKGDSP